MSENLESLRIKGQEFIEDILRLVSNIDKLLLACDRLLYKSQPPSSGRIRVSWEHSENQRYNPVIVRWKRTRNNKWRYDRLSRPTSAVSSKGGFLDDKQEKESRVILMTMHASKGLEFEKVWLLA